MGMEKLAKMSAGHSSSSSGTDYSQFAGNSQGIGCYVDLGGTAYEVPRLDVEHFRHWAMMTETVDVIYPEGPAGSNRIVVDVIHYRERKGLRPSGLVKHIQLLGEQAGLRGKSKNPVQEGRVCEV